MKKEHRQKGGPRFLAGCTHVRVLCATVGVGGGGFKDREKNAYVTNGRPLAV